MSDVGRVLRLDARRSALFFTVPLLAVLGGVAAWEALIPGVAYWDNAVAALLASVRLLGPASAVLAAWMSVREHRLDYLRGLTARSPAIGPLLDLLLLGTVALSAYVVVTAAITVKTVLTEGAGSPHIVGICGGALTLLLYVVVGYLAGRVVSRFLVVPVVGVASALWGVLRPEPWVLLPPPTTGHVGLFVALRTRLLTDQALWSFGLGTALVIGYVWTLTRRRWLLVPLVATAALTVAATGRIQGQHQSYRSPDVTYACRRWPLTICVHPALRSALPSLESELTPLATRLGDTPGAFTRVEHLPGGTRSRPAHGTVYIHLGDLSPGYAHRAEQEVEISLLDARACGKPTHAAGARYSAMVSAWLLDEEPPSMGDDRAGRLFAHWDEQRRRAWLRAHYQGFRTCSLDASDFRP